MAGKRLPGRVAHPQQSCRRNGPACAAASLIVAVMSPPEGAGRRWKRSGDAPEFYSHAYRFSPVIATDRRKRHGYGQGDLVDHLIETNDNENLCQSCAA